MGYVACEVINNHASHPVTARSLHPDRESWYFVLFLRVQELKGLFDRLRREFQTLAVWDVPS